MMIFDDEYESAAFRRQALRKRAQASAERGAEQTDRYNMRLMQKDPQLQKILREYGKMDEAPKAALAEFSKEYAAMYRLVEAERAKEGKEPAPIMVAAEAMRRARAANP